MRLDLANIGQKMRSALRLAEKGRQHLQNSRMLFGLVRIKGLDGPRVGDGRPVEALYQLNSASFLGSDAPWRKLF